MGSQEFVEQLGKDLGTKHQHPRWWIYRGNFTSVASRKTLPLHIANGGGINCLIQVAVIRKGRLCLVGIERTGPEIQESVHLQHRHLALRKQELSHLLRFHRSHVFAAAERPAQLCFPSPCGCSAPRHIDTFLFLLVTLTDAMRSLDVLSRCAQPVTLVSCDLGLSHVTCHRTAYSYVSRFRYHETFTICV